MTARAEAGACASSGRLPIWDRLEREFRQAAQTSEDTAAVEAPAPACYSSFEGG